MSVHDHLWKSLLKAFFPEFLELAHPDVLKHFLAHKARFLEQEAFSDAAKGSYSRMDLVAELPSARRGPPGLLLVLVEIERRFGQSMDSRILSYFRHLRIKHRHPVLPIVLFLSGGPAGVERREVIEAVGDFEVSRFGYLAFGLSQAAAEDYLGRNGLTPALAACMSSRSWRPSQQKLKCLLSILESEIDEARKFLLVNAVETYLDLAEEETMNYAELVAGSSRGQEVKSMELTWAEKIETKGRSEGFRMSLKLMLEERFGRLDAQSLARFESIDDLEELKNLNRRLLHAESLADLGLA